MSQADDTDKAHKFLRYLRLRQLQVEYELPLRGHKTRKHGANDYLAEKNGAYFKQRHSPVKTMIRQSPKNTRRASDDQGSASRSLREPCADGPAYPGAWELQRYLVFPDVMFNT